MILLGIRRDVSACILHVMRGIRAMRMARRGMIARGRGGVMAIMHAGGGMGGRRWQDHQRADDHEARERPETRRYGINETHGVRCDGKMEQLSIYSGGTALKSP